MGRSGDTYATVLWAGRRWTRYPALGNVGWGHHWLGFLTAVGACWGHHWSTWSTYEEAAVPLGPSLVGFPEVNPTYEEAIEHYPDREDILQMC